MSIQKVALAGICSFHKKDAILTYTRHHKPRPYHSQGPTDAKFEVTFLRRSSSHNADPRIKIQVADFASLKSLTAALTGQDTVVNLLISKIIPVKIHLQIVAAAHKAGVKGFFPSEYGRDTSHPLNAKLPIYCNKKVGVVKRLKRISGKDSTFTFISVITEPFWCIEKSFIVNLAGPLSPIYNGGDIHCSTTPLSGIGRAFFRALE
ncbi:oxidoreductase CipA [Penicillium herquei]|nr:oxidoreductase CipA [Penicillium herquei]